MRAFEAAVIRNPDFYFRRGVTWTDLTSGRFSARLSPGGFIFDVKGSSAFPDDIPLVLGLLNSSFAHYALTLLNPTVSFQVGDLARLPIPAASSDALRALVEEAIALARAESAEDETAYDFVAPPAWATGLVDVAARAARLAAVERAIDEEVYRLYGLSAEDRAAIEAELAEPAAAGEAGDDADAAEPPEEAAPAARLTREDLARRWIGYAVGVVLGRFVPCQEGVPGRGRFEPPVAEGAARADRRARPRAARRRPSRRPGGAGRARAGAAARRGGGG